MDVLSRILPRVSRSFYLSLRVLPTGLYAPVGLAYLFCRAADTIADTRLVPATRRMELLERYREAFAPQAAANAVSLAELICGPPDNSAERALLVHLPDCFHLLATLPREDQERIRELVRLLSLGMRMDLEVFAPAEAGEVGVLATRADLDRYTYYVAGCVGEFWTRTAIAHRPALHGWNAAEMERLGVRFGKGLQLTNILRDVAQDVRIGRCYFPRTDLERLGLRAGDLLNPDAFTRLQPLVRELLDATLAHYEAGWTYTLAIPRREWQLRLACAWPLLIGVRTLSLLRRSTQLLDPAERLKISRAQVYGVMARSLACMCSNSALRSYYERLVLAGRSA